MSFVGVGQILCVSFFPIGIEGGMRDVIVLIPAHCLSIYFSCGLWLCFVILVRYKNRKSVKVEV